MSEAVLGSAAPSGWQGARQAWRRLRRARLAVPGFVIVCVFILIGLLAPMIATHGPYKTDLANAFVAPDAQHWFGTDELGRDIFSRVVFGARISLVEGLVSVAIAMAIGVPLGLASGYVGGVADMLVMRFIDMLLAFPGVLLAIVIVSILGPSLTNAMIAVGLYAVPVFARLARSATMTVKEEPYVEACRATGMGHLRIIVRHILPNISSNLLVMATLRVAIAILTAASLSFLGLGAQPPTAEWGAMLANSRDALLIAPQLALFPGAAIILLVLGLNLLQDGLQLVFDPKARAR